MYQSPLHSELESDVFASLLAGYQIEVAALDTALHILNTWARDFYSAIPELKQPLGSPSDLDDEKVCTIASTMLFGETVERMNSASLLLLTGHQSRAIGCCRDALESLQWCHIVDKLPQQARNWFRGKKVQAHRGFKFPPHVSQQLRDECADFFNREGTHPYYGAVIYSLLALTDGQPSKAQPGIINLRKNSLNRVCMVSGLTIAYVLDQHPDLKESRTDAELIVDALELVSHKLVGLKPNFRDPLFQGYGDSQGVE